MPVEVPESFDQITAAWLDGALVEGGEIVASVNDVRVEPMDPSKGLIGDLAHLRVTYSAGVGPASLVIKLPAANPDSRRIGTMLGAYAREVAFYRHVAPRSPGTRLPRCFYAGDDDAAGRWALVLEDLHGDEFDFIAGATVAQSEAAIDALADFHATWWQADERFDWMPGFDAGGVGRLQPLWIDSLPIFLDRYAHVVPDQTNDWVLRFAPRLGEWCAAAAGEPLTMVHSDYRIDNLMFDGDQVTIIDWQTTMRGPAAMDLACFIATSLDVEVRRTSEAELTDRYLRRLGTRGVAVDRAWFLRSYDENLLWWMGQFGNNLAHLQTDDPRVQAALETMIARVYTAGLDHNVGRLLSP